MRFLDIDLLQIHENSKIFMPIFREYLYLILLSEDLASSHRAVGERLSIRSKGAILVFEWICVLYAYVIESE